MFVWAQVDEDPEALLAASRSWPAGPRLLSLVPTQLKRLLDHPAGLYWLQGFELIWVGGAACLGSGARARAAGVPLAPCYGSTETAAMVAALPPQRFLAGETGCGDFLSDVEWRLASNGGIRNYAPRAWPSAVGNRSSPIDYSGFNDAEGWWQSGDRAEFRPGFKFWGG